MAPLVIGVGIIAWDRLNPLGTWWPTPAERVVAYVIATVLIVAAIGVSVFAWRRRRREDDQAPSVVFDEQGFTAWGGLRVGWLDITYWEIFRHHATYDDDVPEDHPDYVGPMEIDELFILVHVPQPEVFLRRLDPAVRTGYEGDSPGSDDLGFGTPIRIGINDLDVPSDEVIAEFERFSKTPPRARSRDGEG